jgi:DNA-binding response OmpR family regulator
LLERWLGEAGYQVTTRSQSGERNLALVIADVGDPTTADAFVGSLREYGVPILVLSARFRRGLAGSAAAAQRLGVKTVLPKPFTRRELLLAVRESMEGAA